jgi:hypothetical protein
MIKSTLPETLAAQAADILDNAGNAWDDPSAGEFAMVEQAVYLPRAGFVSQMPATYVHAEYRGGTVPVVQMSELAVRRNWPGPESGHMWYADGHFQQDGLYIPDDYRAAREEAKMIENTGAVELRTASRVVGQRDDYRMTAPNPGFTTLSVTEISRHGGDRNKQYLFNLTCSIGGLAVPTRVVHDGTVREEGGISAWALGGRNMTVQNQVGVDPFMGGYVYAAAERDATDFNALSGLAGVALDKVLPFETWSQLLARDFTDEDVLRYTPPRP